MLADMAARAIEYLRLESATLRAETRSTVQSVIELARLLESMASSLHESIAPLRAEPDELMSGAARIRGAVLHGHSVLSELNVHAGRIEALASVRLIATDE